MENIEITEQKLEHFDWLCQNIKRVIHSNLLTENEIKEFNGYLSALSNPKMTDEDKYYVSIFAEACLFSYCDILGIPLEKKKSKVK